MTHSAAATGSGAYKISGGADGGAALVGGIGLVGIGLITIGTVTGLLPFIALAIGLHLIVLSFFLDFNETSWSEFYTQVGFIATTVLAVLLATPAAVAGIIAGILLALIFTLLSLYTSND